MGGLVGAAGGLLARGGSFLASSPARAGAAGLAGGALLDDVPLLNQLDPTEGNDGGGLNLTLVLVLVIVLVLAWQMGGSS